MSKQDANRFDREDRRGAARRTYPTQGGPRVGRVQTNVPRAERYDDDFGAKKPYGKKDFGDRPYAGKRDFDERKPYGKPADDFGTKKPYGKKDFGDRPYAGKRDFDERKPADDFGAKKPYGGKKDFEERPHGRDFGDRPYGGDRYYDGDPKRRREERGPRPALPPRAEPAPAEPELSVEETAEMEHMLCGRNPIREALRAGRTVEKLLAANGDLSGSAREIIQMAREAGAVVQMVDRSRLDAIYPSHQGLIAYVSPIEYSTVEKMLAIAQERGEEPFLILLDGITDPHNLGAIIRTAECVGAHGVIVPERRSAGLTPAAAKAAAGALNHMPIARVTNLNRTIDELKEKGVWIIGAAMDGESAFTCDLTGPAALVIGSEGDGISRLTMEKCDRRVSLPMKGHLDSLNASVAAGVLMYEIARARAK